MVEASEPVRGHLSAWWHREVARARTWWRGISARRSRGLTDGDGTRLGEIPDARSWAAWKPPLRRLLSDKLDLGRLHGRICPVERANGRVALLVLSDYARSDEADAVERLLRQRGWQLDTPARYCMPAPLLLAVAGERPLAARGATRDSARSALSAAFDDIVAWALRHGASDIHFNVRMAEAESAVRFTIDGRYVAPARFQAMPSATVLDLLAVAWMRVRGGQGAVFDPHAEQQGRIDMRAGDEAVLLRWAALATDAGPAVCLRVLRPYAGCGDDLTALGYLPSQVQTLQEARNRDGGAIVLAGNVGSGKSSTLATLLNGVPATRKLVTLEDPVEYGIAGALQSSVCRTLDRDDEQAFTAKLRTVKRLALDDLLIGEVRDRQTGQAFMDLVASGTRIYTTTHAGSALLVPVRLASDFIGVSRELLASPGILKLIVYQVLLPRLCPACAVPLTLPVAFGWLADLQAQGVSLENVRMRAPTGCERCRNDAQPLGGYRGRTVAAECLAPAEDDVALACIRRGDHGALGQWLRDRPRSAADDADMRHKTAAQCAVYKVLHGEIDPFDVHGRLGPLALRAWAGR